MIKGTRKGVPEHQPWLCGSGTKPKGWRKREDF